jgi:predicted metal-dependent phosphoesterase TrpH
VADSPGGEFFFVDLHVHSSASFDSLSQPAAIVRAAASRGLTHVAITDHERIDGALRARDAAAQREGDERLTVIVGEEIRSTDGDIIGLFLDRPIPAGLSGPDTIAAIHEQRGLAGIPHPFDRFRFSGLTGASRERLDLLVEAADYVEAFNARVPYPAANTRAAELSRERGIPGIAASDAHTLMEVGVAYTRLEAPADTPDQLRAALGRVTLVTGHASLVVRGIAPAVKLVQHLRGNRRMRTRVRSAEPSER